MALEVYKTEVDVTSATLSDLAPNLLTGHIRRHIGKDYILCKAAGGIPDGGGAKKDATTSLVVTVISNALVNDIALCVNNTGGAITSGHYFWGLRKGYGYALADTTGLNDGEGVITSGEDANKWEGRANAEATTKAENIQGIAVVDSTATTATNFVMWDM